MTYFEQPLYPQALRVSGAIGQVYIFRQYGRHRFVYPYYYPYNPRTSEQQYGRNLFSYAVANWQGFSSAVKGYYNELEYPGVMSGYNRYISMYMAANYVPPTPGGGDLEIGGITSARNSNVDSLTFSHTVGVHNNNALVVFTGCQDSNHANFPVTSVKFGAQDLVKVRSDEGAGSMRSEIWKLENPAVGTADIVVTYTGTLGEVTAAAVSLYNADTSGAIDANDGLADEDSTAAINLTTNVSGDYVFAILVSEPAPTGEGAGQTVIALLQDQSFENTEVTQQGRIVPAGIVPVSFNLAYSGFFAMSVCAVKKAP